MSRLYQLTIPLICSGITLFCFPFVSLAQSPKDSQAVEVERNFKPRGDLNKATTLFRNDESFGGRVYYDNGNVFTESLWYFESDASERLKAVEDGDAMVEAMLKDAQRKAVLDGAQRKWHRNGQLWENHNFKDGVMDGACRSWNQNGKLLSKCEMSNGSGVLRTFRTEGALETECPYYNGKRHGINRRWYRDGNLLWDESYHHGVLHGWSRSYHSSGQIKSEAKAQHGKTHGISRYWNEGGELVNSYQLSEPETPPSYENRDVSPYYYVNGVKVTRTAYIEAARKDVTLPPIAKIKAKLKLQRKREKSSSSEDD